MVHPVREWYRLNLAGLLIFVLVCAGTVTAAPLPLPCQNVITLNEGDPIANNISAVCSGGTIILNPGTYSQHNILVNKDVRIQANTSYGHNATDTIIDAQTLGRIFDNSLGHALTIDNLSLQNGHLDGGGGAIENSGGTLIITSSRFTDCSAVSGGAISMTGGTLTISSSTFSGCDSRMSSGGAIYNNGGDVVITTTTFSDCTSLPTTTGVTEGGAIYLEGGTLTISSSVFKDCFGMGGGAIKNKGGIAIITSSTFSRCGTYTGGSGGAIVSYPGTLTVISSTFENCYSGYGGAIDSRATLTITSSTFENCSAFYNGGAIRSFDSTSTPAITFSRFYHNTAGNWGPSIAAVSPVDAMNNWWGSNSNPSALVSGPVTSSPWLMLCATASPPSIMATGTSVIRSSLTYNMTGHDTSALGHVPDGIMNTFAIESGSGSVLPLTAGTVSGIAGTTFSAASAGTTIINTTVDGQSVYTTVTVPGTIAIPVTTVDTSNNDDGFPSVTVSPATTGAGILPPMTVTVNIGGDSKAWQAVVTGTKLSDLIVTGTVQTGPGDNQTAPPGTVFQYISLAPARYGTISNTVLYFSIPQSWLDENHIDPKSIVLYHQTANEWEALPTSAVSTKDGTVYFSAQSTGFSLFAIVGTPTVATPAPVATMQAVTESVVQTPAPAAAIVKAPVTTQTTAPPATAPQPAGPSPLLNIVLVVAAIGVLAGGGFMARRWWIRQQNPALFGEY